MNAKNSHFEIHASTYLIHVRQTHRYQCLYVITLIDALANVSEFLLTWSQLKVSSINFCSFSLKLKLLYIHQVMDDALTEH
jgi:hypothetical protein